MSKEIYNEGRVVGLSAYEIYVQHHLAEDPNTDPATEKEWLASSIAMGSSMLLKVPSSTSESYRYVDIQLPHDSKLAAANTIVASFFDGSAHFPEADSDNPDDQYWADRITDYGTLISNTNSSSPATGEATETTTIPTQTIESWGTTKQQKLVEYMSIIDGIIIQPGEWKSSTKTPPKKDFIPNLTNTHPRIRLFINGPISNNPLILLTGFTINSVLSGTVGTNGSTDTKNPSDGDFLGPTEFPWVAKVVFSVPNAFINYMILHKYGRTLNESTGMETGDSTPTTRIISDTPIIDMKSRDPQSFYDSYVNIDVKTYEYYDTSNADPRFPVTIVDSSTGTNSAVLTVYQKKYIYPPALYGTYVSTGSGQKYLNPIDVVAPGTVKMFYNQPASTLSDYESTFPGTWAFNRTSGNKIQILVNTGTSESPVWTLQDVGSNVLQQWISLRTTDTDGTLSAGFHAPDANGIDHNYTGSAERPTAVKVSTDTTSYLYLSIDDKRDGTGTDQLTISSNPSMPSSGTNPPIKLTHYNSNDDITWSSLLAGLTVNKAVDVLGDNLKVNKYSLSKPVHEHSAQSGHNWNWTGKNLYDQESGASYLQFGADDENEGLRLYGVRGPEMTSGNSGPLPNPDESFADIPEGSLAIGPGWHSIYKVVNSSVGRVWAPLYGSEFNSGHIKAVGSGSTNYETCDFEYGFVILGRCSTSPNFLATVVGNDPQPTMYNDLLVNYYMDNGTKKYYDNVDFVNIWYIDRFGTPNTILQGDDDFELRMSVQYEQDGSDLVPHTRFVKLVNNSTTYAMEWMLIGKLNPDL